jgi:hypothetical protein
MPQQRCGRMCNGALVVFAAGAAVVLGACRAPERTGPVDAPPAQQAPETVLERTNIAPGEPGYRPPTAPPAAEPTPRPLPPPTAPEEDRPAQPPASPHPPGVPRTDPAAEGAGMRELFPHVRADLEARIVEFDGIVPIDAHDPGAPRVYLEVTVCIPDSKEHESLVMTRARPSHVHAALLAIGLTPGHPGRFEWDDGEMRTIQPEGDPVVVTFIYRDKAGEAHETPAMRWVVNAETGEPFAPAGKEGGFVFAGSVMRERMGREVYDADGIGTLVGLHTFGAETIAWRKVMSPDSHIEEPEWIADSKNILPFESEVTVRVRPAE